MYNRTHARTHEGKDEETNDRRHMYLALIMIDVFIIQAQAYFCVIRCRKKTTTKTTKNNKQTGKTHHKHTKQNKNRIKNKDRTPNADFHQNKIFVNSSSWGDNILFSPAASPVLLDKKLNQL